MLDRQKTELELDAEREIYLRSLYGTIISGGQTSVEALEELSSIALGGNGLARDLVNEIDRQSGGLKQNE